MKAVCVAFLMLIVGTAVAGDYDMTVTRKGSNLYKVDGENVYIHTRYCYEYVYSEDSLLRMSGTAA